mgnify:CR=1 FL=1
MLRLLKRNYGKPEDFRYAQWRKEWGDKVVLIAFFRVFMVQGIILLGEILIWTGLYASGITLIFTKSVNPFYYLLLAISPWAKK